MEGTSKAQETSSSHPPANLRSQSSSPATPFHHFPHSSSRPPTSEQFSCARRSGARGSTMLTLWPGVPGQLRCLEVCQSRRAVQGLLAWGRLPNGQQRRFPRLQRCRLRAALPSVPAGHLLETQGAALQSSIRAGAGSSQELTHLPFQPTTSPSDLCVRFLCSATVAAGCS